VTERGYLLLLSLAVVKYFGCSWGSYEDVLMQQME
jgi:hypothetical protein